MVFFISSFSNVTQKFSRNYRVKLEGWKQIKSVTPKMSRKRPLESTTTLPASKKKKCNEQPPGKNMKEVAKSLLNTKILIEKAIGDAFCEEHKGLYQFCGKKWFVCDGETGVWTVREENHIRVKLLDFICELINHLDDKKQKKLISSRYLKGMPFIREFFYHDESSSTVFQRFENERLEGEMTYAACWNNIREVKKLHKQGVSLNARCRDGYNTPLFYACAFGQHKMFDYIMSHDGIDVNTKTDQGRTPLHAASEDVCLPHVERLIEAGADVTAISNNGSTVLHYASECGGIVVKKLLDSGAGAVVNKVNDYGFTALMVATINNKPGTVEMLIKGGADVSIRRLNPTHHAFQATGTAFQMAKERKGCNNALLLEAFNFCTK